MHSNRQPDPAERLIAEFSPRLYRYALVRLGRRDLAEDAVAETLCRLVEKGPPLPGPREHVHGWCVRCLVNVCRELARRPRPGSLDADRREATTFRFADWRSAISEESQRMIHAMGGISDRQREAVTLRVLMGLPVAQVAVAMGCAEGTVKALTHQALAALRSRLETAEGGAA